jgi:hypothetical protein
MAIEQANLQKLCGTITDQVRELYPNLQILFIPHANGLFHHIVETGEYDIQNHPASDIAHGIMEKTNNRNQCSFLGMAIHNEVKWFGFASKDMMLALFNLNLDEFKNEADARQNLYHLVWHALDLAELRQRPEYSGKFKSGPMIPKRSPMNLARLNLQADIFASMMSGLYNDEDAIGAIARKRAFDTMTAISIRRAEDYPFCIAMESAEYAFEELQKLKIPTSKYMYYARQIAVEVSQAFSEDNIRRWWGFAEPAQDMVWRDVPPEITLGAAMYSSEDAYIRAIGHLIQDITEIQAEEGEILLHGYNAYANPEQSRLLHREMIEQALEEAIAIGIVQESGQPLFMAANQQNEGLAEGHILGWCANAMQAAARAFENALSNGSSPDVAARMEFEGTRHNPDWDTLKKLGETIVGQKRVGFGATLGQVAEICSQSPAFASVMGAIKMTMNDPGYIRKIEAANDFLLGSVAPTLAGPAPVSAKPSEPVVGPVFAPSAPGLGGGAVARNRAAILQRMKMKKSEDNPTDGDTNQT